MTDVHYNLSITEFPGITNLGRTKYGLVFIQAGRIVLATRDHHEVLVNMKTNGWFCINSDMDDGFWCSDEHISKFYDVNIKKITSKLETKFNYGAAKLSENLAVGQFRHNSDNMDLYCKHLDTDSVFENSEVTEFLLDNETNIYCYNISKNEYTCYDKFLKKNWYFRLNKEQCQPYFCPKYYLFEDSVIINGIVLDRETDRGIDRCNYEVLALYKTSGKVKWRCVLDNPATRSYLSGDRVYIYRDDIIIVVDARTGDIMFEKPTGFAPLNVSASDSTPEDVTVFSYNNNVFVFSMRRKAVRIYDMKMEILQEIPYPKPDSEYCLGSFGGAPKTFVTHDKDVYCVLSYAAGMDGLVRLSLTNTEPTVEVKSRPFFIHEKVPEKVGYAYKLSTNSENLDEVVSGGEFALKEIAQYLGSKIYTVENKHDAELNDHLIFSVKKSALPPDAVDDLKRMVERLETYFRNFRLTSGKTKKNFRVELELR